MSEHTSKLMTALNFDRDDLVANRQGNLSKAQADRLKGIQRRNIMIGVAVFFVLVIISTTLIFFGQQNESTILSGIGGLLTVINAVMIGVIGRSFMRTNADLRDGGVEMLDGKLERVVRRGRRGDNYLIRVGDASIYVTQDIFLSLQHEKQYRLYRTRLSGVLLSAERD